MKTIAEAEYWNEMWGKRQLDYDPNSVTFKDVFDRHLPTGGDCFEVGCYPGGYLIYLSKRFNYRVHGIDMYPRVDSNLPQHLARHGANVGTIIHGDFFRFVPPHEYDVVCSFGFVEHFTDLAEVFRSHANLVKPGGMLVMTCPNFRRGQYLLHRMLDHENLEKHVLSSMDLNLWSRLLTSMNMSVLELGYYKTFDFWVEPAPRGRFTSWLAVEIRKWAQRVDRRINRPNRYFSPFMYAVCRKPH